MECSYQLIEVLQVVLSHKAECSYQLIEVLPVVLSHKAECTEQCPTEVIEIRVSVVGVVADDDARVVHRTLSAQHRAQTVRSRFVVSRSLCKTYLYVDVESESQVTTTSKYIQRNGGSLAIGIVKSASTR